MAQLADDILHDLLLGYHACLFTTAIQRLVRRRTATSSTLSNTLQHLKNDLRYDGDNFWAEPGRTNLLTFLYWCDGSNKEKLEKQNQATLEHFPDNIAALTMKWRLLMSQGRTEEAKVAADNLASLRSDHPLYVLQCEGEVAYAFYELGPKFYGEAIRRYEQVIEKYDNWMRKQNEEVVESLSREFSAILCSWRFHLARCYSRFLQVNKREVTNDGPAYELYRKTRKYLEIVIQSDCPLYKDKAKIELMTVKDQRNRLDQSRERDESTLQSMRDAMNAKPTDKFVFERFIQQLIQLPHSEELLHEALRISKRFEKCGFAWQRKAKAYVFLAALWKKNRQYSHNTDNATANPARSSRENSGSSDDEELPDDRLFHRKAKRCYHEAIKLGDGVFFNHIDLARTCMSLGELDEADEHFTEAERLMTLYPGDVYDANISYLYCHWAFLRAKQAAKTPKDEMMFRDFRIMSRKSLSVSIADTHLEEILLKMLRDDLGILSLASESETIKLEKHILEQVLQQDKFSKRPLVTAAEQGTNIRQKMRQLVRTLTLKDTIPASMVASLEDALTRFLYLSTLWKANLLDLTFRSDVQLVLDTIEWLLYLDEQMQQQHSLKVGEHHDEDRAITFNFPVRDAFRWILGNETLSARGFRPKNNAPPREEEVIDVCLLVLTTSQSKNSGYVSDPVYKKLLKTLQIYLGLNVASFGPADSNCHTEFDDQVGHVPNMVEFDRDLDDAISHSRIILLLILTGDSGLSQNSATVVNRRESCQRKWEERLNGILRDLPEPEAKKTKVCLVLTNSGGNEYFEAIEDEYLERWPQLGLQNSVNLPNQELVRLLARNLMSYQ